MMIMMRNFRFVSAVLRVWNIKPSISEGKKLEIERFFDGVGMSSNSKVNPSRVSLFPLLFFSPRDRFESIEGVFVLVSRFYFNTGSIFNIQDIPELSK